jgi:hypothetical protein
MIKPHRFGAIAIEEQKWSQFHKNLVPINVALASFAENSFNHRVSGERITSTE